MRRSTRHLLPVLFALSAGLPLACRSRLEEEPSIRSVPPAGAHAALAAELTRIIEHEMEAKALPAVSIALVEGGAVVWAEGFGEERPGVPASAGTVYRVGSVSKLLTDVAVMQLVEEGKLDLDAPVTEYVPELDPENPYSTPITLRQLMCHRAGLVREPPVGSYFDPSEPNLRRTVESLSETTLVYPPGTRTKYSNAGIAVVGRALELADESSFSCAVKERVLRPLGMTRSSFEPDRRVLEKLATALMWTYHDHEFEAPGFQLGTAPAGNLCSTVLDLARFIRALWPEAGAGAGRVPALLSRETLEAMWQPQFGQERPGFGLGFFVSELDGRRRAGHNGAIYGFSTVLDALPDERLGVVVAASRDVTNDVLARISEHALRGLLAVRGEAAPSAWTYTAPLSPGEARRLAGTYQRENERIELAERGERLFLQRHWWTAEVRAGPEGLVVDGRLAHGARIRPLGEGPAEAVELDGEVFDRVEPTRPPPPERWDGLLGEYGWEHNTLYILEKDGRLCALIEWFFLYPLSEESRDVFAFPRRGGLYHGERLYFERDESGKALSVEAAGVLFPRRDLVPADGDTFRITPTRSIDEIRRKALEAAPPGEEREFKRPELVDLVTVDPTIRLDIRYATRNNFMGAVFYEEPRAFLQAPAAAALARVSRRLREKGYGLLVHDAYRPWYVTKMFWEATPEHQRDFVANPAGGSRHNRGCAVDLTLYELETGEPVEMPSGYDEFTERAHPYYPGGTSRERWHRDLLRRHMEDEGFEVYEYEWWHFDHADWRQYPIANLRFSEIPTRD